VHPRAVPPMTACDALPPPPPPSWWTQGDAACPQGSVIDGAPPPKGRRVWCRTPFGIKHGPETTFDDTGRVSTQGTHVDGRRAGPWSSFMNGQLVSERGECNGLAHGRARHWIAGGTLLVDGTFHEGEPTGKLEQWDHQGKLLGSYELPGGSGHVVWWSNHSGEKGSEGDLVDGKKHGVWTSYWPGGKKSEEGSYDRGKRTGVWRHWRPDGRLESEGTYRDDKPFGTWTTWDERGTKRTDERW
jgi:antitoxin component YwqK of YwqJK toxin-antitoxin module